MLIYLIEDDRQKAAGISSFINAVKPDFQIQQLLSYQSGLKALQTITPNFVILDMTLPTFDVTPTGRPGRPRPVGGYEIMRKMRLRRIACPVLLITQLEKYGEGSEQVSFAEMNAKCLSEFPDMFLGGVYYHPTQTAWQDALENVLFNLKSVGLGQ